MKTHYNPKARTDVIELWSTALCGAGQGVSQYGVGVTGDSAQVTCKRCLKRLEAAEVAA